MPLPNNGATRQFGDQALSRGFLRRGDAAATTAQALDVLIPQTLEAEQSVCGLKAFLIDERRSFPSPDGGMVEVDCAKVADLDIVDSPVHVHGETLETYHVLSGQGKMVMGEEIVAVQAGSMVLIPPGVPHGLCSDSEEPLRVVMTFTPGLASVQDEAYRDEKILFEAASQRIAALNG